MIREYSLSEISFFSKSCLRKASCILYRSRLSFFKENSPFPYLKRKGAVRTAVGAAPRESHPRVVLTRPCSLPATLQTLGLRRQGSIIVLSARRRPQAATPALRPGKIAPLTPMRESLLAHLPPGSAQTECIRLPYDAPPLSCGRICQGAKGPPGKQAGGERESRLSMAGALTVSRQWD